MSVARLPQCLLCAGVALAASLAAAWAGAPVAEQVMAELRAANAARAELLREQQAWAAEQPRRQPLSDPAARAAERLRAEAAEAARDAAELRKPLDDLKAKRQRLEQVEATVDALAERLEKALDGRRRQSLPGLVPADRAAGITEPSARLAAAAARLDEARRQARKASVEIVAGALGGQDVTVKLLRIGGVAAWWTTLDGQRVGTAVVRAGRLVLWPAPTSQDDQAIQRAFAIVEGRAAPDWVLLPAGHVGKP